MPPSTDIARKKRGNEVREKTERPVGGQKGHKGATHPFESNVTETVDVSVGVEQYENNLLYRELPPERRQVLDIKVERVVIEYRSRVFVNVKTGKKVRFEFPEGVNAPVQYGEGIKAMVVTLRGMPIKVRGLGSRYG
jgi:transposase